MSKRIMLLALAGTLVLSLAGCGDEPAADQKAASAPVVKKEEPVGPVYELTKDSISDHADWTSKNISVMGAKLGDITTKVQDNFGKLDNTRNLQDEYLTVYQSNGLFVYTQKTTGKAKKFEVYDSMAKQVADEKFKKLLTTGDLKFMRDWLGPEEKVEENADDQATEYAYDARGFRFVQYKVPGSKKAVSALRFQEVKKPS